METTVVAVGILGIDESYLAQLHNSYFGSSLTESTTNSDHEAKTFPL
jgi:hypothetical protein